MEAIANTAVAQDPFKSIALTLSGGGFRAASFALGTMSYLNHLVWNNKPMLQHVKAISSVSGGTITGLKYAETLALGGDFHAAYEKLYEFLRGDTILNRALQKIEDNGQWVNHHKRQTLINAFALSYHEFLSKEKFGLLTTNPIGHLEEVIFNATEFSYANAFRFQTQGVFGNGQMNNRNATLGGVRDLIALSDIVAASSCFPVGFEPMLFPNDFLSPDHPEYAKLVSDPRYRDGVGLMDGGIIDNQGLGSILLAQSRREGRKAQGTPFTLILITDVASPYMDKWSQSNESFGGWRAASIGNFNWNAIPFFARKTPWYVWTLILLSACMVAAPFFTGWSQPVKNTLLISGSFLLALATAYVIVMPLVKNYVKKKSHELLNSIVKLVPDFFQPLLKRFESVRLGVLERMLRERGSSAVTLLSDVFLKQVRRQHYNSVYKDKNWEYKRVSNFVYELTDYDFKAKQGANLNDKSKSFMYMADPELNDPGPAIKESAFIAAKMDTTLWFTDSHTRNKTLDHLVACGHFTTCYNLLIYLTELEHGKTSPYRGWMASRPDMMNLYNTLLADWKKFKANPFWLLQENAKSKPL